MIKLRFIVVFWLQVSVGREKESVPFMKAVDEEWKEKHGQEM